MFQFLIGTLKTENENGPYKKEFSFQFLIGTLKTQAGDRAKDRRNYVSIPDRYSKNQEWIDTPPSLTQVSIPDRYSKNDNNNES